MTSRKQTGSDWDVRVFAQMLEKLPEHVPVSDAMEAARPQEKERWWSSQREHMVAWFRPQATRGSGAFVRLEPNLSAAKTYQRFSCAEGLISLAEAVGVDPQVVERAAQEALAVDRRLRCGVVRRDIPWSLIAEAAFRLS